MTKLRAASLTTLGTSGSVQSVFEIVEMFCGLLVQKSINNFVRVFKTKYIENPLEPEQTFGAITPHFGSQSTEIQGSQRDKSISQQSYIYKNGSRNILQTYFFARKRYRFSREPTFAVISV